MTLGRIDYQCPECGTTNVIHERFCKYEDTHPTVFEKAHIDIIASLSALNAVLDAHDMPVGVSYKHLVTRVDEQQEGEAWREIHNDVLHSLKDRRYIAEDAAKGGLYLKQSESRKQEIIPTFDPVRTVYEHGPVDGCKDYCVYTMISWCELVGLTWEQTRNFFREWMEETGSWEEQSWGENSISSLLDSKQHIYDRSLGWGDYAEIAKRKIEQTDHEPRIDADAKLGAVSSEDYESETQ